MSMEQRIRIRFIDMHGGKQLEVEVRANYTVEQTIDKLVKNSFINQLQPGQEYVLMLKRENRRLLPTQTLRDAGVNDGDLLQAGAVMRGG